MRRTTKFTFSLMISFLLLNTIHSQTIDQKVESAATLINGVSGLFKKKKQVDTINSKTNNKESIKTKNFPNSNNVINAGNLISTTRLIDCDDLPGCFNYGILIIKKGDTYALIDSSKFLIPYGQYDRINYYGPGLAQVYKKSTTGLRKEDIELIINYQGKAICDLTQLGLSGYYLNNNDLSKYLLAKSNSKEKKDFVIDNLGNKYLVNPDRLGNGSVSYADYLSDTIIITKAKHETQGARFETFGAKTIRNTIIKSPELSYFNSEDKLNFIDGYSIYREIDQFKRIKFGIVSDRGEKTCIAKFSSEPMSLGGGFFMAKGSQESDIEYAIVNFRGEVIFKELKGNAKYYFRYFEDGYFISDGESQYIMDLEGKIFSSEEFFLNAGLKNFSNSKVIKAENATFYSFSSEAMQRNDGFLKFRYFPNDKKVEYSGLYNIKTKKILLGNFMTFNRGYDGVFDPISGLARVRQYTGKLTPDGNFYLLNEGFIDSLGNFVILMKKEKNDF